jgi:hypothetical protein
MVTWCDDVMGRLGSRRGTTQLGVLITMVDSGHVRSDSGQQRTASQAKIFIRRCCPHSILGPGKRHEANEGNGAHPRLTRCDLFDDGELLWGMGRPQRHDQPATHFELLNQRRRDMPKRGCHDHSVERTAFQPSMITVADLDPHIVVAEVSQHLRSGFGQRRDNLNGTNLSYQTRQYCGLVT